MTTRKTPDNITPTVTLGSMIKIIGEEAAAYLSAEMGGRMIYIPQKMTPHSPLATCIGFELAKKVSEMWPSQYFEVPIKIGRKYTILKMRQEGVSVLKIAATLHISIRCVRSIVNDRDAKSAQLCLFEPD